MRMGKKGERDFEEQAPDTDVDEEGEPGARRGCVRVALFVLTTSAFSVSLIFAVSGAFWAPEALAATETWALHAKY